MVRRCVLAVWMVAVLGLTVSGGEFCPKYLALTFDDGPTKGVTEQLILGLEARYVSATFFLCGYRMAEEPALVELLEKTGNEVGIHGYHHTFLQNLSRQAVVEELEASVQLTRQLTGQTPTLFRPPGGLVSPTVEQVAEEFGLSIIFWAVDPVDWNGGNPQKIASHIVENAKDGDVILMHDLQKTSVQAALQVIDTLEAQGFTFVTVSQLAQLRGQDLEFGKSYWKFPPNVVE